MTHFLCHSDMSKLFLKATEPLGLALLVKRIGRPIDEDEGCVRWLERLDRDGVYTRQPIMEQISLMKNWWIPWWKYEEEIFFLFYFF